jgi:hypothetical protein
MGKELKLKFTGVCFYEFSTNFGTITEKVYR